MKIGKMTAVIAVRKGSQRVVNKNQKPFGDTNLLELKIKVLSLVPNIDEIIVNSESDEMLEVGKKYGCITHKREAYFSSNACSNSEVHGHLAEVTKTDHIFLTPVCSPFISVATHTDAIKLYMESDFDSLTSTDFILGHLWLDGKPINYDLNNVPNSQDLPKIRRLNYGISIIDRNVMVERRGLVGKNPGFYDLDEIQSIDVNYPIDFKIAETLYLEDWMGCKSNLLK